VILDRDDVLEAFPLDPRLMKHIVVDTDWSNRFERSSRWHCSNGMCSVSVDRSITSFSRVKPTHPCRCDLLDVRLIRAIQGFESDMIRGAL
jgi:hypothetical protein